MSQLKIERNVVELNLYVYIYIYFPGCLQYSHTRVQTVYQKCVDEKIGFFWTLFGILLLKRTYNDLFVTKTEKNKKFLDRS